LAAGLFVVLRRRRSTPPVAVPPVDNRPPHVIALTELDEIEQADFVGAGQFQQHYTRVSETTRRYLEREFALKAMEATTYELQRSMQNNSPLDMLLQKQLIGMLQEADVVKFAKIRPNSADARQLPAKARQFISASHAQMQAQQDSQPEEVA
jgi:hypothetical protein